jgi:hypothetical protein
MRSLTGIGEQDLVDAVLNLVVGLNFIPKKGKPLSACFVDHLHSMLKGYAAG